MIIKKVSKPGSLVYVPASRVPILKFIEKETGIEVDFNVNNILALSNSELLYTYC
jgi:DNA polymerase sigma